MGEKDIFQNALHNFTFDVASRGAINHLAALGYTPKEIQARLDFPTPYARVQEAYYDYCIKERIIIEDIEEISSPKRNVRYVAEYDSYGHKSFRQVTEEVHSDAGRLNENEKQYDYVRCDFGLRSRRAPEEYEIFLRPLDDRQREYIEGIPWPRKVVWHRLDDRMRAIIDTLRDKSDYSGSRDSIYKSPTGY